MPSDEPRSLIIKSDSLGIVGDFDPTVLARIHVEDSLHAGKVFLRATLDEMVKIRQLSRILDQDNRDLLQETEGRYFDLNRRVQELQSFEQRGWIYKLLKRGKLIRLRRALVFNTFELWNSTTTKSGAMKEAYLITPTADLAAVEGESVPRNQPISGLVLDIPKGPVTPEAFAIAQEMIAALATGNPFVDLTPSDSLVGQPSGESAISEAGTSSFIQSSSPSSRSSASSASYFGSMNLNVTVINNTNSTTSGIAITNASGNGGPASGDSTS